jgi:hypothetical protein
MNAESLKIYHDRAVQLADGMRLCQDDLAAYASTAALLAVHSGISYGDAVLIRLEGKRPKHEDHRQTVALIEKACRKAGIDSKGITHLQQLLSAKNDISYGDKSIDDTRIARLCIAAERFHRWAERILA